jgi:transcriptional regulator with GAF, ATPase, and Fis domain
MGGTSLWVHLEATAARNADGSGVCRVVMSDITDRKIMEDALQQSHDKLEQKVAERTAELVAAMEDAEKGKQKVVSDLSEIKMLKDQLEAERAYLIEEIKLENNHEKIIGKSEGLKYVLYKVEQIAGSDTIVLVLGETGTGKELVARAIHALSSRKNRALVKVNCAALPANLIESELFGHEKGAFTGAQSRHLGRFEVANGATLFLDEIGELPLELQPKLLRVLQDGEFERLGGSRTLKVDARIIVATNRNLEEEVRKGHFREDLWYRLNVFPISVPPLRDRKDDIPLLVNFYVQKIAKRMGKTIEIIPANVMDAIRDYHWPGNIRELENVLERAVINSSGPKLRLVDELKKPFRGSSTNLKTLDAVERDHIVQVLEQTHWKIGGKDSAAEILGLDRSTLRARMRKLGIQKP